MVTRRKQDPRYDLIMNGVWGGNEVGVQGGVMNGAVVAGDAWQPPRGPAPRGWRLAGDCCVL